MHLVKYLITPITFRDLDFGMKPTVHICRVLFLVIAYRLFSQLFHRRMPAQVLLFKLLEFQQTFRRKFNFSLALAVLVMFPENCWPEFH